MAEEFLEMNRYLECLEKNLEYLFKKNPFEAAETP